MAMVRIVGSRSPHSEPAKDESKGRKRPPVCGNLARYCSEWKVMTCGTTMSLPTRWHVTQKDPPVELVLPEVREGGGGGGGR